MPILKRTTVRSPWLPGPLQGSVERVRPALVVAAIVPAVLLGSSVEWIGRPAPPEDVNKIPRPPLVVVNQPTIIPARVFEPPRPTAPNPIDRLSPGPIVQDPPDPTLAKPQITWTSRPAPPEDTTRPPQPANVDLGWQPVPSGAYVLGYAPRDFVVAQPDRLNQPIVVQDPPDPTLVRSSTSWVGRPGFTEDTTRPPQPVISRLGWQPVPGATYLLSSAPKDQVVVQPDRLNQPIVIQDPPDPTLVKSQAVFTGRPSKPEDSNWPARPITPVIGAQPHPEARYTLVQAAHWVETPLPPRTSIIRGQQPVPVAQPSPLTGRVHATQRNRLAVVLVYTGSQPRPTFRFSGGRLLFLPPLSTVPGDIRGPGQAGSILSSAIPGDVESPGTSGSVLSPGLPGTTEGPGLYGKIRG